MNFGAQTIVRYRGTDSTLLHTVIFKDGQQGAIDRDGYFVQTTRVNGRTQADLDATDRSLVAKSELCRLIKRREDNFIKANMLGSNPIVISAAYRDLIAARHALATLEQD